MPEEIDRGELQRIVAEIFRNYARFATDDAMARTERRSGILLKDLTLVTLDPFLEAMRVELSGVTEVWKAKFVIGMIRQMVLRARTQTPPS